MSKKVAELWDVDERIDEMWDALRHNERILSMQYDPYDTSTHPCEFSDGDVGLLLEEIDRLRKRLGLKPLKPRPEKKKP